MTNPSSLPGRTLSTVITCLRYHDAPAMINWLCRAFGFQPHLVVPGPDDTIAHAQLAFGRGMVMLGSAARTGTEADEFGRFQRTPREVGGIGTQSAYVIVEDADAHHAQAVAAGARVVLPLKSEDYGGRGYSCLDPEGHLWNFGTYDPWA